MCVRADLSQHGMEQRMLIARQRSDLNKARHARLIAKPASQPKPHLDSQPIQEAVHADAGGPTRQASLQSCQPSCHCTGCRAAPRTGGRGRATAAAAACRCCACAAAREAQVKCFQLEVDHYHGGSGGALAGRRRDSSHLAAGGCCCRVRQPSCCCSGRWRLAGWLRGAAGQL